MNTDKVFKLLVIRALVLLLGQIPFSLGNEKIAHKWLDDANEWSNRI